MTCFHTISRGHPDDFDLKTFTTINLTCPICRQQVIIPVRHNCPKCEEILQSEVKHWQERYAQLISYMTEMIRQIEQQTGDNSATLLMHQRLIALRNKIENENNLE
jgi:hypothetical protein